MLSVYKGGYYFDEIAGIYKTMYKAIDIPLSEAIHKYELYHDYMIIDYELHVEFLLLFENLLDIEK